MIPAGSGSDTGWFSARSSNSSRMMSMHNSTHSSQMYTEGPAMSLRTSCWLLPQNEQYRSFRSPPPPRLFLLDIALVRCSCA